MTRTLVRSGDFGKKKKNGSRVHRPGPFSAQRTHLEGPPRPLFTVLWNIDTWTQSAGPKSGCELGQVQPDSSCRASGWPLAAGGRFQPRRRSSRRPHRGSVPSSACPRFGRRLLCLHHTCKCHCSERARSSTGIAIKGLYVPAASVLTSNT